MVRFRLLALLLLGSYLLCGCYIKQHVKGQYYLDSEKYKRGVSYFKEEVRKKPDDPSTNYFMGRLYLADKKTKEGLRYLKRSVQLNPQKADYHFWLGVAYSANKRPKLERKSYLKALSLDKRHHQALTFLGHVQLEKGELKPALKSYTEALKIQYDNPQALYNRALILKRLGRTPEEKAAWNEYLAFYSMGIFVRSAVVHLNALGDFEYQNYRIGDKMISFKSVQFEPFSAKILKGSKPSLDHLGAEFAKMKKFLLHIVAYQKNNIKLAEAKTKSVKRYLLNKFPGINSKQIKLSWFDVPKTVKAGRKKYSLDQAINFFTEKKQS